MFGENRFESQEEEITRISSGYEILEKDKERCKLSAQKVLQNREKEPVKHWKAELFLLRSL